MKWLLSHLFLLTIIGIVFLCPGRQAGAAWVCPAGGNAHNSSNINQSSDALYTSSDCTGQAWTGVVTGNPVAFGGQIATIDGYECSPYQIGNCYNFAWVGMHNSYKVNGTGACIVGYRSIFGDYLGQCTWQYELPTLTINNLSGSVFAHGSTVRVDGKTIYPNAKEYFFSYKVDNGVWAKQNTAYNGVSNGWDWWFTFPSLSLGQHTVSVKVTDDVGESNTVATTFLVNTAPKVTAAVSNAGTWVKNGAKLNISGTITDPDAQNFTVSYAMSAYPVVTIPIWTVCRSASSTSTYSSFTKKLDDSDLVVG